MDPNWRDRKFYPALGILALFGFIYLNYFDKENLSIPIFIRSLPKLGFVGVNGSRFVIVEDGNRELDATGGELYVNGWNSYWLMEESVWDSSRYRVSDMLKIGAEMGMTVCRTWAFSDGARPSDLQTHPGVFNERVFKGLDFVVYEARKHRIRLILSLVNNLNAFGGKAQYLRWAEEAGVNITSKDSFFSNPIIKEYYKSYVKAILTRKNSFTGIKYSEEPAIFAWELMNEPRCNSSSSAPTLQAWITEMAAYVKSLDRKHLVTVGLEGFYSLNSNDGANPGEWAGKLGSDFIKNSAIGNIDFASVHAYPHSWIPSADLEARLKYLSNWVDVHINDSENVLKKPVLFTEVGALLTTKSGDLYDRDILLRTVYDKIFESAKKRGAGAGVLIWQLLVDGVEEYGDKFSFVAGNYPSTYKLILEQSCRLRNMISRSLKNQQVHKDPCFNHKRG